MKEDFRKLVVGKTESVEEVSAAAKKEQWDDTDFWGVYSEQLVNKAFISEDQLRSGALDAVAKESDVRGISN